MNNTPPPPHNPSMDQLAFGKQDASSSLWPPMPYGGYPLNVMTAENMAAQYGSLALYTQQMNSILMSSAQVSSSTTSPAPKKKKPTPVPPELKDAAYIERRARNNDSAKRSREARRQKEDTALRSMDYLLRENNALKAELCRVQAELNSLRLSAQCAGISAPNPSGFVLQ